jgi:hypothetical protein
MHAFEAAEIMGYDEAAGWYFTVMKLASPTLA